MSNFVFCCLIIICKLYDTSFYYCREFVPGTVSLTGDWVRGDDSKQNSYYSGYITSVGKEIPVFSSSIDYS